jgi:hypothetical protein
MLKRKKIKFELLITTEKNIKKNNCNPTDFLKNLIVVKSCEFIEILLIITTIIFVCASIVYSDNLIKQILKWFINILKYI